MTTTTLSPNGLTAGFVYRRHWLWIEYPEPLPEADEPSTEGIDPDEERRPRFRPNPDYGPRIDEQGRRVPGFAVKVMCNPTGAELREARETWDHAWRLPVMTEEYDRALDAHLQVVAWRVREWRAYAEGDDGTIAPIPAPGEVPLSENADQWKAFRVIPDDLMYWVLGQIRVAHLLERDVPKGWTAPRTSTPLTTSTPAGPTATTNPAPSTPAPVPPPS